MEETKPKVALDEPIKLAPKMIGQTLMKAGHKLWELEVETGVIIPATYDSDLSVTGNKKLTIKPGCLYTAALNKKNAFKHFLRMVNGTGR
jgi:hypothetical protein